MFGLIIKIIIINDKENYFVDFGTEDILHTLPVYGKVKFTWRWKGEEKAKSSFLTV